MIFDFIMIIMLTIMLDKLIRALNFVYLLFFILFLYFHCEATTNSEDYIEKNQQKSQRNLYVS